MARIKLVIPTNFSFSTQISVRITDLNYGNHLGNDAVLSIIHEARVQYLKNLDYKELEFAGLGLIMSDVAIEFKAEAFYGDVLNVFVTASDVSRVSFDLYYKLVKTESNNVVAVAKTGMICFDYERRKVTGLPTEAAAKLNK